MIDFTENTELIEQSRRITIGRGGTTVTRAFDVETPFDDVEQNLGSFPKYGDPHPTIPGISVTDVRIEPYLTNACRVYVTWSAPELTNENQYGEVWEWDWSAERVHITSVKRESLQLHYPPSASVGTAIGVDGDTVHGVDVYRPTGVLRVSKRYASFPPLSLRQYIVRATSCVNDSQFFEFGPYEALFLGAQMRPLGKGEWQITFNFNIAETRVYDEIQLGNGQIIPLWNIPPWDYLWFRHREHVANSPDGLVKQNRIVSAHLARVYDSLTFAPFNLRGP